MRVQGEAKVRDGAARWDQSISKCRPEGPSGNHDSPMAGARPRQMAGARQATVPFSMLHELTFLDPRVAILIFCGRGS